MIALLFASLALAAGVHAGIPVQGVPGLSNPSFLTPETGWTAQIQGGFARIYVGETEADAAEWYDRAVQTLVVPPPAAAGLGDEAHGDGVGLFAFRDGNVGVLVRAPSGARAIAERLHAAIVDGVPRLPAPRLAAEPDGTWRLDAPGAVHAAARGASAVPFSPGRYAALPEEVVVWDAYGRPTVWRRE